MKVLREISRKTFALFLKKNACKKFSVAYKGDVPNETVSFGR